jgi:hypothetical protein
VVSGLADTTIDTYFAIYRTLSQSPFAPFQHLSI